VSVGQDPAREHMGLPPFLLYISLSFLFLVFFPFLVVSFNHKLNAQIKTLSMMQSLPLLIKYLFIYINTSKYIVHKRSSSHKIILPLYSSKKIV
jgi:hypothetical protein